MRKNLNFFGILTLFLVSLNVWAVPPTLNLKNQFGEVSKNYVIGGNAFLNSLLTGYVAGVQGAVVALSASDSILQGMQKLDGNKPSYIASSFSATFDHAIGAKSVVVRQVGKSVTLEIPLGATADGLGTVIASGATDLPAADRPAADLSFPVVVSDNAVKVFGVLKVLASGQLVFGSGATSAGFTNAAAAGFDRIAVHYTLP